MNELRNFISSEVRRILEGKETYAVYRVPARSRDLAADVFMDESGDMDVIQISDYETGKPIEGYSPEDEEKVIRAIRTGKAEKLEVKIEERSEHDPCWEGYTQVGMKTDENGNKVPNCVPTEDVPDAEGYQEEGVTEAVGSDPHQKLVRILANLGVRGARYDSATDAVLVKNDMESASIDNLKKNTADRWTMWSAEVRHKDGYDILKGSSLRELGREIERTLR